MIWDEWVAAETIKVRDAGRWRMLRTFDGGGPTFLLEDGRSVVSFASNDYLGLSQHSEVIAAAHRSLDRWGTGAGASRLVVGSRPAHAALEEALAAWRNVEAALVLPSGYHANLAVLTTFGAGARIVSDELNHASIIDAARLARAETCVYRHGDVDHAAQLLMEAPGRAILVTDNVFSMDGDLAPLRALSEICWRWDALLVVDDAHAVLETEHPIQQTNCLRIGTLSKALGSQGGYIAGPNSWIDLLINKARPFIFTTALAPACAAAALAAIGIVRSNEGFELKLALRRNIDALNQGHPSPILPVVLGSESSTLAGADHLLNEGILVPAIRPPTVPVGTSRLRIALSAAHTPDEVIRLRDALEHMPGRA